jgi:hypothetical protein
MFDAICPLHDRLAPEWFPRVTNRARPGPVEISAERNRSGYCNQLSERPLIRFDVAAIIRSPCLNSRSESRRKKSS